MQVRLCTRGGPEGYFLNGKLHLFVTTNRELYPIRDLEQGTWFEVRSQSVVRLITLPDRQFLGVETLPIASTEFLSSLSGSAVSIYGVTFGQLSDDGLSQTRRSTRAALGTFVPNSGQSASQDVLASNARDIPSLARSRLPANVRPESFMGVIVESWTPGQKDPPVFVTNSRYIFVDKW